MQVEVELEVQVYVGWRRGCDSGDAGSEMKRKPKAIEAAVKSEEEKKTLDEHAFNRTTFWFS